MKKIEVEFEFEIGDVVVPKGVPSESNNDKGWRGESEFRYQICKRWAEECPIGVQKLYTVMWFKRNGEMSKDALTVNESMFRLSEPFKKTDGGQWSESFKKSDTL